MTTLEACFFEGLHFVHQDSGYRRENDIVLNEQNMVVLLPSKSPGARVVRGERTLSLPFRITGRAGQPGVIVHTNGSVAQVIKIDTFGVLSHGVERLKLLMDVLVQQVSDSGLDVQLVIASKDYAMETIVEKRSTANLEEKYEYLSWFEDYLHKWMLRLSEVYNYMAKEFYIVLSTPVQNGAKTSIASSRTRRQLSVKLQGFCDALSNVVRKLAVLDSEQIRCLVHDQLTVAPGALRKSLLPPLAATRSTLSDYVVTEQINDVRIREAVVSNFLVSQLPAKTTPGWLREVLQAAQECTTVSIHIARIDQTGVRRKMQSALKHLKGPASSVASAVIAGTERAVELSIYASVSGGRDLHQDSLNHKKLIRAMHEHGAVLRSASKHQVPVWLSCLAVGRNFMKAAHTVTVRNAVSCFSLNYEDWGQTNGIPFGFGRHDCHPTMLNLFENGRTANLLVLGSGDVETDHLFSSLALRLSFSHNVFMVGSLARYSYLCETFGPEIANFAAPGIPVGTTFVNPCETLDASELTELICQICVMSDGITVPEYRREQLRRLIEDMAPKQPPLSQSLPPLPEVAGDNHTHITDNGHNEVLANSPGYTLLDICSALESQESLRFLKAPLHRFLNSVPGHCFSSASWFDVSKRLVQLDTSLLDASAITRHAALRFLIGAVKTKVKGAGQSVVMIDEVSPWVCTAEDRALLKELIDTAAANGVALVLSSREPYVWLSNALNDYVIKDCAFTAVLRQPVAHIPVIASRLRLCRKEVQYLCGLGTHGNTIEMLLRSDERNNSIGLSFVRNPMEKWLAGLTREEITRRNEMMKDVKSRNPKINHTDTCRQAIYYLGLSTGG